MAKNTVDKNEYWDRITDEYADEILSIQPVFFHNAGILIDSKLEEGQIVADIGNGGVINYNYENLTRLDCIDLSISHTAQEKYKDYENISFLKGNVIHLDNIQSESYDSVIIQCTIHHLAEQTYKDTEENVIKSLRECMRILKPNGKLLIVESVVVPWFEKVERLLYGFMQIFFKLVHFDTVYQYSADSLVNLIERESIGYISETQMIDIGKYMWLLKKKVLNRITPCRAVWICIEKTAFKK